MSSTLSRAGHEAVVIARSRGVDVTSGAGAGRRRGRPTRRWRRRARVRGRTSARGNEGEPPAGAEDALRLPEALALRDEGIRRGGVELEHLEVAGHGEVDPGVVGEARRLRAVQVAHDASRRIAAVDGKEGDVDGVRAEPL